MHEHLREEDVGVGDIIAYYNSWAAPLVNGRSLVLSYERLREDPQQELAPLWPFLGLDEDEHAVEVAIERSKFENLQKLEEQEQIPGFEYDVSDPEARRVRRGKIGGWRDYLDEDEAEYVRERCRNDLNDEAKALLRPFWPDVFPAG
jgi:alcohol sulfotransferase